jgi:hypothetical protein
MNTLGRESSELEFLIALVVEIFGAELLYYDGRNDDKKNPRISGDF